VDQFRAQTAELEQSNRWAESLNEELRAYAVRTAELEAEAARLAEWARRTSADLDAKVAELAQCVEYLHAAEREVEARTKWAFGLEAELKAFQAKLEESRWMRLGRTLGMGPVVGRQ
jgi:predicted  nucleic acid-binding Zn-ribbon protein